MKSPGRSSNLLKRSGKYGEWIAITSAQSRTHRIPSGYRRARRGPPPNQPKAETESNWTAKYFTSKLIGNVLLEHTANTVCFMENISELFSAPNRARSVRNVTFTEERL